MIRELILVLMILNLFSVSIPDGVASGETTNEKAESKIFHKYPPYPDVWDWVVPKGAKGLEGQILKLSNGDILVTYTVGEKWEATSDKKNDKSHKKMKLNRVTIFGKQTVIAIHDIDKSHKNIELNDGAIVHPAVTGQMQTADDSSKLTLSDLGGLVSDTDCYWPVRKIFRLEKSTKQSRSFVIFKLLNAAKVFDAKNCSEYNAHIIRYRVESVGEEILNLDDGTFLVEIEAGILIRFDQDFHTKSRLINDKYIVVEHTPGKGRLMINELTNKDYNMSSIQRAIDDLHSYLIKIKEGGEISNGY